MAIAARMNRRLPHKSSPSLTDLLSHPEKITEAIEQERRAKSPSGWLGIQILARPDWQKSLALGDGVYQVSVHRRSSAYRDGGMRTGDFLRPIEVNGAAGVPIDEFDLLKLPIGTKVTLRFFRPGTGLSSGWLTGEATLTAAPRNVVTLPAWKMHPQVLCGERVVAKERYDFVRQMAKRPHFTAAMKSALNVFAFNYDNDENEGFWPSYQQMAEDLGYKQRHNVVTLVQRLRWEGVLELVRGPTKDRKSNTYRLTWPRFTGPRIAADKSKSTDRQPRKTWRL
jgi:hypothetical protein